MNAPPITVAQLTALRCNSPATWAPLLSKAIADNGIRNSLDWLANMLHESGRFATLRENLNYDAAGLLRTFPKHFTTATAATYGRAGARPADQYWIAEYAYGGRMGNRAPGTGDGWNFRGTGPLQNTGHDNIMAFANSVNWTGTLEVLADQLAIPTFGAAAAGKFWRARGCDALPNPTAIRTRVNGGANGLAEVLALRVEVARVLAIPTGRPPPTPPPAYDPDNSADDLNAATLKRITT